MICRCAKGEEQAAHRSGHIPMDANGTSGSFEVRWIKIVLIQMIATNLAGIQAGCLESGYRYLFHRNQYVMKCTVERPC